MELHFGHRLLCSRLVWMQEWLSNKRKTFSQHPICKYQAVAKRNLDIQHPQEYLRQLNNTDTTNSQITFHIRHSRQNIECLTIAEFFKSSCSCDAKLVHTSQWHHMKKSLQILHSFAGYMGDWNGSAYKWAYGRACVHKLRKCTTRKRSEINPQLQHKS